MEDLKEGKKKKLGKTAGRLAGLDQSAGQVLTVALYEITLVPKWKNMWLVLEGLVLYQPPMLAALDGKDETAIGLYAEQTMFRE